MNTLLKLTTDMISSNLLTVNLTIKLSIDRIINHIINNTPKQAADLDLKKSPIKKKTKPNEGKKTKQKNNLKSLVINFQSIKNKKEEFRLMVTDEDPDIVIGTETWLHKDINNARI